MAFGNTNWSASAAILQRFFRCRYPAGHGTYHIRLKTHSSAIFGQIRESEEFNIIVRTPWNGCLSRVFGTTSQQLCRVSNLLGDYLGGVARIHKVVSCGEPLQRRLGEALAALSMQFDPLVVKLIDFVEFMFLQATFNTRTVHTSLSLMGIYLGIRHGLKLIRI